MSGCPIYTGKMLSRDRNRSALCSSEGESTPQEEVYGTINRTKLRSKCRNHDQTAFGEVEKGSKYPNANSMYNETPFDFPPMAALSCSRAHSVQCLGIFYDGCRYNLCSTLL